MEMTESNSLGHIKQVYKLTSRNWAPIFRLRSDKPGMQLTKFTLGPHLQGYPKNDRVQKYPKNDRVQNQAKK